MVGIFVATFKPPKYEDFGVYNDLKKFTLEKFAAAKARPVETITLKLSFPYSKIFGSDVIALPMKSFETDRIAAASISQFEVPPGSGYFRDFTFNIRPQLCFQGPGISYRFHEALCRACRACAPWIFSMLILKTSIMKNFSAASLKM